MQGQSVRLSMLGRSCGELFQTLLQRHCQPHRRTSSFLLSSSSSHHKSQGSLLLSSTLTHHNILQTQKNEPAISNIDPTSRVLGE